MTRDPATGRRRLEALDDEGAGPGRPIGNDLDPVGQGVQGPLEPGLVVRQQFQDGLTAADPLPRPGQAAHARHGADRILLAGPPRPEPPGGDPDRPRVQLDRKSVV